MGTEIYQGEQIEDIELDPDVQNYRNKLFEQYVYPFRNMIYKLCIKYSWASENVEENYTEVLANFYRRIGTYDPARPIRTWLHVVTKRHIQALERKRSYYRVEDPIESHEDEDGFVVYESIADEESSGINAMGIDNYRKYYNDDILSLLDEMKPIHRDALILQESGYSLKEIVEIEYRKGNLKSRNIETVKSRLFLARQYLKKHLTRDGQRIFDQANHDGVCQDCDESD